LYEDFLILRMYMTSVQIPKETINQRSPDNAMSMKKDRSE